MNETLLIAILFAAGFLLRLYNIGDVSLWYDEIMTAGRVSFSFAEVMSRLRESPFPPLYYSIMHLWTSVAGTSEFALRFPSLIFSSATIPVIYLLTKKLFGPGVAALAGFLFALSPYSMNYAQDAKMYSLVWLLGTASFLAFLNFFERRRWIDLVLYVSLAVCSLYTLYVGFFFLIMQSLLALLWIRGDRRALSRWFIGQAAILILFLPSLGAFYNTASTRTGVEWIERTKAYVSFDIALRTISWMRYLWQADIFSNSAPALKFLLYYLFGCGIFSTYSENSRQRERNILLLITWIVLPCLFYFIAERFGYNIFHTRYIGLIHIPAIIIIAHGIDSHRPLIRSSLAALFILLVIVLQVIPFHQKSIRVEKEDWRNLCLTARQLLSYYPTAVIRADTDISVNEGIFVQGLRKTYLRDAANYVFSGEDLKKIYNKTQPSHVIVLGHWVHQYKMSSGFIARGHIEMRNISLTIYTKRTKSI